ncbi:MAG: hypothetical protein ACI8PZ_003459 [Myxococcota bacterium]|jgi:hypothetical protein
MASDALRDWLVRATVDPSLRWTAPAEALTADDKALVADPVRLTALVTGLPDGWPTAPHVDEVPAPRSLPEQAWAVRVSPVPDGAGLRHVLTVEPWSPPAPAGPAPDTSTWVHDTARPEVADAVVEADTEAGLLHLMRTLTGRGTVP